MHSSSCLLRARGFIAALAVFLPAIGYAQATLYGVSDLSGGATYSEVRDATKTGGVIYAVGGSSANGSANIDTAFLWTSSGGITALPNLVTNTTATNPLTASAITPDAAYIASRARSDTGNSREAVRVTVSGPTNTALGWLAGTTYSAATAISNDGSILYGFSLNSSGKTQAFRADTSNLPITAIPFIAGGYDYNIPAARGITSSGSLMLGTATNSAIDTGGPSFYGAGNQAFIYDHNDGQSVSPLTLLSGGTWNMGLALNTTGTRALLGGNSTTYANGELYIVNNANTIVTTLGSPNSSWQFANLAGMSDDASVVGVIFGTSDFSSSNSYIWNTSGWHDFYAIASGAGANLTGWTDLKGILGVSADGTLVWGYGTHNGATEGFVIEFSSGYLAAIPEPADIGAWTGIGALLLIVRRRLRQSSKVA